MPIANPMVAVLEKQLDASSIRQRVIANNLANANTPGFKKSEVSFSNQLQAALDTKRIHLKAGHPRHISTHRPLGEIEPKIITTQDTLMTYGQNNVDTEEEMVNLAANTILYNTAAQLMGGKMSSTGYVIKGGK